MAEPEESKISHDGLRVAFQTLGCRSNYADSVELQAACLDKGAIPASFEEGADVFVINTCTVTDEADNEALRVIRRLKRRNPEARVVVTGCMAEVRPEKIMEHDNVSAVVGTGKREDVIQAIFGSWKTVVQAPGRRSEARQRRSISLDHSFSDSIAGPGKLQGEIRNRARFHLRIQEGCENSCTFCIIPLSRGGLSSREKDKVLSDLARLAELGYREVVLTGTHLGGYGEDNGSSLLDLLVTLEEKSEIRRLRLSSIDPNDVSQDLVKLISKSHVFCPHMHICVQAFSDNVLKRMNRRYGLAEVSELLCYVESCIPRVTIGSDVIVGFPGESRQDIEQSCDLLEVLPISYLHVFPYSERQNTPALKLDAQVPVDERKLRAKRLRALSHRKRLHHWHKFLGRRVQVVVEDSRGENLYGTTREYLPVRFSHRGLGELSEWIRYCGREIGAVVKGIDRENHRLICEVENQDVR